MRLFCRVAAETAEVVSMEAPIEMCPEKQACTVLTENVNGSADDGDKNEAEPEEEGV